MEKTNELHNADGLLSFDPIVTVLDVLRRWFLILLVAVIVGVGAYIYKDASYTPSYRTSAVLVVTSRGSSTSVYNNLSSTSSIANLFTELLNSSLMRKTLMEEMGVSSLDAQITTAVIPNTNLITLSVTSSDPRTAFVTARTLLDTHEELTYAVVDGIIMEVLQQPSVPSYPTGSAGATAFMKKMAVLAAAAAVAAIAVISWMRDTVRSSTEAQKKLNCEYLGSLPHERKYKTWTSRMRNKKRAILIGDPVTGFHYVESVRKLRRRVEQRMGSGKVLMVTSLLENEGKSTVSVNLALAMAQKQKRVLLIDGDLRKPSCHLILDHRKFEKGLLEVLQGGAEPADAVIDHDNIGLDLLLSHKGGHNIGDLLASGRMEALLQWAAENYDCVLLDMPPVAVAADTEGVTALVDAALLVVRQNAAVAPALNKALETLEGKRAKVLGCVLNNVHTSRFLSGGGGYGYGSHYGGYYNKYDHYRSYGSGR